ncbi:MAG: hypothetical protein DRJ05_17685 [Bacteroidetes bacterium]|nr:MAG: hypothetical protein DRJ05_17685 [Bacteroidota bacterium]
MNQYHKIPTVFSRDPETNYKTLLVGQFATPELDYLQHNIWVFTEKVDGTNIRVIFNEGKISFGGKTDKAQMPASLVNKLNEIFLPQLETFTELFKDAEVCMYGEGYGPKIQKGGGNYRSDQSFVLFDIRIGEWWLKREDIEEIAKKFGLDVVPIIGEGTLKSMVEKAKKGFNSTWGDFAAEGIVARPKTELIARNGKRIITKIKFKDFI